MNLIKLMRFITSHPLNRSNKAAALSRFARWQLASRLISRPIALPFVNGTSLLAKRGATGATGNWYCGLHEPAEMGFALHVLRPGDLFLDVGANVGSYTVLAAGAVGAKVISVEPIPATFDKLRSNIRYNNLEELVDARMCGLSSEPGEIPFIATLDTMNRVLREGESFPTVNVPVITLDELCGGRRPLLIKIDVEGHEMAVLDGAAQTLGSPEVQALIMETEVLGGETGDKLRQRMAALGFHACTYDPFTRRLTPRTGNSMNTILVRDVERMNARCAAAPRHTLVNGTI